MNSFKIKLPDNVLCDHLDGLSPKSRNFELVRLATNGLLMERGVFSISNTGSDKAKITSADTVDLEISKGNKEDKGEKVDFGIDIINV